MFVGRLCPLRDITLSTGSTGSIIILQAGVCYRRRSLHGLKSIFIIGSIEVALDWDFMFLGLKNIRHQIGMFDAVSEQLVQRSTMFSG